MNILSDISRRNAAVDFLLNLKKRLTRWGIEPQPPGWKESMLTITLSELVEIWRSRRTGNFTARCFISSDDSQNEVA